MSKEDLNQSLKDLKEKKAALLKKKAAGSLAAEESAELEIVNQRIAEELAASEKAANSEKLAETKKSKYQPEENEMDLVHAELIEGSRFDPETGKEVSKPFIQKFTEKEFALFAKNASSIGFKVKILYKPEN